MTTDRSELKRTIIRLLEELFEEDDLDTPVFTDDVVLLETELDSLGFAVLVTRLDEELGYDPFSLMDKPVYPTTLGEFVAVYADNAPGSSGV